MKKLQLTLLLGIVFMGKSFAQSSAVIQDYIQKFKDIAIEEMRRTGVPASITLAQGIHETSAGQSDLVIKSNNHFGIKCKSEWQGPAVYHDDDARGECFRKYESPFESYKDHSDFLAKRPNYTALFRLDPMDYEAWAFGLKKAGYATNPKYPQILIKLIRDYNLQDYTLIAMGKKEYTPSNEVWAKNNVKPIKEEARAALVSSTIKEEKPQANYPAGIFKINDTRVVYVPKGTSYLSVAYDQTIALKRLFEFNELPEQEVAMEDQLIYVQRKRKTGANQFHTVTSGESLHDIAQAEGIRMESLLEYNHLQASMKPQPGQVLYLHESAPAMPKLATASAVVSVVSQTSDLAKSSESVNGSSKYIVHTVQAKETVYSISRKYSVSPEDVRNWNDLQNGNLRTGQQLRIKRM
jgi:LysM repeat protein